VRHNLPQPSRKRSSQCQLAIGYGADVLVPRACMAGTQAGVRLSACSCSASAQADITGSSRRLARQEHLRCC